MRSRFKCFCKVLGEKGQALAIVLASSLSLPGIGLCGSGRHMSQVATLSHAWPDRFFYLALLDLTLFLMEWREIERSEAEGSSGNWLGLAGTDWRAGHRPVAGSCTFVPRLSLWAHCL